MDSVIRDAENSRKKVTEQQAKEDVNLNVMRSFRECIPDFLGAMKLPSYLICSKVSGRLEGSKLDDDTILK